MKGALKPMKVSTKQQQIAQMVKQTEEIRLTSLNHYLDEDWFMEAFRRLKKNSAPGIDNTTVQEYGTNLYENVKDLIGRAKSGKYYAPPVKRVYIPKGNGDKTRPIGIPATEDKLLQRAVVMLLEPIYEYDFLDCSYGFRPGRSPHQALLKIWQTLMGMGGGWVLDVDIRKYFDNMGHSHIRSFVRQRVNDGVILRLIDKWLKAGVIEKGALSFPEEGSPQGGVISPLLSNIYLHYVLDSWIEQEVKPRLTGPVELVRFADDFVLIFKLQSDALRVQEVLAKRFGKFGLTIHPDKTRLVHFEAPWRIKGKRPETFNFLGFTHYWGKSRKGKWVVKRKTAKDRLTKALKAIHLWCRDHRHIKLSIQHEKLVQKLRGHYNYYGINGNFRCLQLFLHEVTREWRFWLNRRNRESRMPWNRFQMLLKFYPLPTPRIAHARC
jgi:RNA-directed DNA polymerase